MIAIIMQRGAFPTFPVPFPNFSNKLRLLELAEANPKFKFLYLSSLSLAK